MSNESNLIPITPETAREMQRRSAKARKRNRTIAETAKSVMDAVVTDERQLAAIKKAGLPVPKKPTYRDFIVASIMLRMVQKGRVEDLEKLATIVGDETKDMEESGVKVIIDV